MLKEGETYSASLALLLAAGFLVAVDFFTATFFAGDFATVFGSGAGRVASSYSALDLTASWVVVSSRSTVIG